MREVEEEVEVEDQVEVEDLPILDPHPLILDLHHLILDLRHLILDPLQPQHQDQLQRQHQNLQHQSDNQPIILIM